MPRSRPFARHEILRLRAQHDTTCGCHSNHCGRTIAPQSYQQTPLDRRHVSCDHLTVYTVFAGNPHGAMRHGYVAFGARPGGAAVGSRAATASRWVVAARRFHAFVGGALRIAGRFGDHGAGAASAGGAPPRCHPGADGDSRRRRHRALSALQSLRRSLGRSPPAPPAAHHRRPGARVCSCRFPLPPGWASSVSSSSTS